MNVRLAAAAVVLLALVSQASAHRLDEYLQAAMVDVQKDRVAVEVRLTPGVAVFRTVLAMIDTDGDGVISEAEERDYAQRVLQDLSLTLDGKRLPLRIVSSTFPKIEEMKEGLGEIVMDLEARVPPGRANRRLVFENHHQQAVGAYLVNCLAPTDPDIRIAAQSRNYDQSLYQLDYAQAGIHPIALASSSSIHVWLLAAGVVLLISLFFLLRGRVRMRVFDLRARSASRRG